MEKSKTQGGGGQLEDAAEGGLADAKVVVFVQEDAEQEGAATHQLSNITK